MICSQILNYLFVIVFFSQSIWLFSITSLKINSYLEQYFDSQTKVRYQEIKINSKFGAKNQKLVKTRLEKPSYHQNDTRLELEFTYFGQITFAQGLLEGQFLCKFLAMVAWPHWVPLRAGGRGKCLPSSLISSIHPFEKSLQTSKVRTPVYSALPPAYTPCNKFCQ